jgi:catechol 2,3-dioxygenase-like lactoylglutathione lyase family enzyme
MMRIFVMPSVQRTLVICLCAAGFCLGGMSVSVGKEGATRPPITAIARVQIYVTNVRKAVDFYEGSLGFTAAPSCSNEIVACLFVNDQQQIQLLSTPSPVPANLIAAVAFSTPDLDRMHSYMVSSGGAPGPISSFEGGEMRFTLRDPEGHAISFLQSPPRPAVAVAPGQISSRLIHAGLIVYDRQAEDHFYKDILGFRLYWQGGMKDSEISWVSMQVPDGTDWIEYMLHVSPDANAHEIGIMNHIALGVADIQAARLKLLKNGGKPGEEPKLGRDGKWQLNLYDPDGTRVEFMEFTPKEKPCCSPFTGKHPVGM